MSERAVIGTLAALALGLVLAPFFWMLAMGGGSMGEMMGGGMAGGGMAAMHAGGLAWLILTIVVIAALVALLVRSGTRA